MGKLDELLRKVGKHKSKGMPYVRTSDGHLVPWNKRYIVDQLLRETKLCEKLLRIKAITKTEAEKIASIVEERVKKLDLKFVSAPLIREMVNNVLLELSEENPRFALYRNLCTRCGIPVYDAYTLLQGKVPKRYVINPDLLYKKLAYNSSREMALLLMPLPLADAHLKGDINIHDLENFLTKLYGISYDLRFLFFHGLRMQIGLSLSIAKCAKQPDTAIIHAAKILERGSTFVSNSQVLLNFSTFLAPYFEKLSKRKMQHYLQTFLFEVMHHFITHSLQKGSLSIQISPHVTSLWKNKPIVYKGEVYDRVYGEFEDLTNIIFNLFIDLLTKRIRRESFMLPIFEFLVDKDSIKIYKDNIISLFSLLCTHGEICIENLSTPNWEKSICSHHMYDYFSWDNEEIEDKLMFRNYSHFTLGIGGIVSINLPRLAYRVKGEDERLIDQVMRVIDVAYNVLSLKYEWLRKLEENKILSFSQRKLRENKLLNIDKVNYIIGLVGLRDMVYYHTNAPPLKDNSSLNFMLTFLNEVRKYIRELNEKSNFKVSLVEVKEEIVCKRLAVSDMLSPTYRYCARKIVSGDLERASKLLKKRSRDLPVMYTSRSNLVINGVNPESLKLEEELSSRIDGHTVYLKINNIEDMLKLLEYLSKGSNITHFILTK